MVESKYYVFYKDGQCLVSSKNFIDLKHIIKDITDIEQSFLDIVNVSADYQTYLHFKNGKSFKGNYAIFERQVLLSEY